MNGVATIDNFGWIWPGILARSAQPSTMGFQWLARQGFQSIVNLRAEYDDLHSTPWPTFHNLLLPTRDHHPVSDADLTRLREWLTDSTRFPCLVHCASGSGRSGYVCAVLRWAVDEWEWPAIKSECEQYRVPHWALFWIKWLDPLQRTALKEWMRDHPAGEWR